jgi:NAD+ diphosphatase
LLPLLSALSWCEAVSDGHGGARLEVSDVSEDRVFAFDARRVLVSREGAALVLPTVDLVKRHDIEITWIHQAVWDASEVRIGEVAGLSTEAELPGSLELVGVRSLFNELASAAVLEVGRARQILDWRLNHRVCGFCATPTEHRPEHGALGCPECGRTYFPRVSPAVIMAVHRGDRILLGRAPGRPEGWFSTLAGFVEAGESLEECVAREVLEEVGLQVDGITYFGSQPWPFPDSLMVGFTANYVAGEIVPQPGEIEEAGWFSLEDLPAVPPPFSIARALIDDFVRRQGGDPAGIPTWVL